MLKIAQNEILKLIKSTRTKEIKLNEMNYILFNKIYINLQQFQVIPENKTQGNL